MSGECGYIPLITYGLKRVNSLCYTLTFANMKTSSLHGTECQSENLINYLVLFRIHYGNSVPNLGNRSQLKSNLLSR